MKTRRDSFTTSDVVEIRVHGVSNTPPESTLGVDLESLVRVAGDDDTTLYASDQPVSAVRKVRAYSWGNLTHGNQVGDKVRRARNDLGRALWMLLLPFAFCNVAFWTRTQQDAPTASRSRTGGWGAWALRVFSLSITATFAVATATVTLGLVVWQWVIADGPPNPCNCIEPRAAEISWLAFLRDPSMMNSRAIAVGSLVAMGVLFTLWGVAHRSFQYETETSIATGAKTTTEHPMESLWFWRGRRQVSYLSYLHLTCAAATIGLLTLAPILGAAESWWDALTALAVIVLSLAMAVCIGLLSSEYAVERSEKTEPVSRAKKVLASLGSQLEPGWQQRWFRALFADNTARTLALLTIGTLAGALALLVLAPRSIVLDGPLPGLDALILILIAGQAALLVCLLIRWRYFGDPDTDTAWKGTGPALLSIVGWMAALLYSAVTISLAADYLNGSGNPFGADTSVRVPSPLVVTAGLVLPVLVVTVLIGITRVVRLRREAGELQEEVRQRYQQSDRRRARERANKVALAWSLHRTLEEDVLQVVGRWVMFVFAVSCASAALLLVEWSSPDTITIDEWNWLPDKVVKVYERIATALPGAGSRILILLGAGLALVATQIYRGGFSRRPVGVLWDVATFWPRACHPWAPPCYAERVVPQLVTYIGNRKVKESPSFILAGHSQGSVICAAVLWQLPTEHRKQCALLTFGTQLRVFYGRAFPAFFRQAELNDLAGRVLRSDDPTPRGLKWRSLWRRTDPIGYPVRTAFEVDMKELRDPDELIPLENEIIDPAIHGHSDYPVDPQYIRHADDLAAILRARRN